MTITQRLMILAGGPLLTLIGLGILTRVELADIRTRTRFVTEMQLGSLAAVSNISATFAELRLDLRSYLLSVDKTQQDKFLAVFQEKKATFNQRVGVYSDTLVSDDKDRRLLNEFRDLSSQWLADSE